MDLLRHNQETLNKLLSKLDYESRVGVVQATGTGKGCIASTLITESFKDKKIVLLASQSAILVNYLMALNIHTSNRVKMMTYQGICRLSDIDLYRLGEFADILILDEYHRCGAKQWGRCVIEVIKGTESHGGKAIGFTATPKRYLDGERDMSSELFNDVVVEGVDLTLAIKRGILPVFTYVKARYGYLPIIREYQEASKKGKVKKIITSDKLALIPDNDTYIQKIISTETKELGGLQKWIVFCNSIDDLQDIKGHISKWFTQPITIFEMHSKLSVEQNRNNLVGFTESHRHVNVLLTVDKLNEGVHVKDISGILMMRKTSSPIIFMQQLGRALSAGNSKRPYIFDLVGNIDNIQNYEDLINNDLQLLADDVNAYAERKAKKDKSKGGKILLRSYCEDIDNVLKDIQKVMGTRWTEEEDNTLIKYFKEERKAIVARFPSRNWDSIYQRARMLGLVESRNEWTRQENNIIKKYYPLEGVGVVIRLNNRTEGAVKAQATKLGVKKDKSICWTDEEDELLRRHFSRDEKPDIEKVLRWLKYRHTTEQVYQRLKYLKLSTSSFAKWTQNEDAFLQLAWGNMSMDEIEERLPRHTRSAIYREVSYLGLTENLPIRGAGSSQGDIWSEGDILALIETYNEYGSACFTLFEPRTERAVRQEITKLKKDLRYKHLLKR